MDLVLDTSAYSRMRIGHGDVLDRMAAAEVVLLPTIVLGELHAAFELGGRKRENETGLEQFLLEPFVRVLDVTPRVSRRYGQVFAALRRAGTPIPINDVWIAACAIESGARLLTFDRDFERVVGLDVEVLAVS